MKTYSLTIKEQIHFAKRMNFLLKAGISLVDSIHVFTLPTYKKHIQTKTSMVPGLDKSEIHTIEA